MVPLTTRPASRDWLKWLLCMLRQVRCSHRRPCTHVHTHAHMHTHMHTCTHTCTHAHGTHAHGTHTCTHTSTHIKVSPRHFLKLHEMNGLWSSGCCHELQCQVCIHVLWTLQVCTHLVGFKVLVLWYHISMCSASHCV